jgi:hypothetical protein
VTLPEVNVERGTERGTRSAATGRFEIKQGHAIGSPESRIGGGGDFG